MITEEKMRTQEEITTFRSQLQAEKDRLPRYSSFGDDNWQGYETMFDVLDGIYTTLDDLEANESSLTRDEFNAGRDALSWLAGEIESDELV
jgi:hypothetical protein